MEQVKVLVIMASDRGQGVLAYFTHLKCQKRIGDDVGLKIFYKKNNFFLWVKMTP
jgi:hypothetical protein